MHFSLFFHITSCNKRETIAILDSQLKFSSRFYTARAMAQSQRYDFIDMLRGLSCIFMIETHVVNALMLSGYRYNPLFYVLNTINGFVSILFLFCAGAGFWIASERKFEDYLHLRQPLLTYVKRLLFILLVAYWLKIPEFSIHKVLSASPEKIIHFFSCDVLDCIVASSFLSLALLLCVRNLTMLRWLYTILALVIFFGSQFVAHINLTQGLPIWLGGFVAQRPDSAFGLIPWSGYFFSGIALTAWFFHAHNKHLFARRTVVVSAIALVIIFGDLWLDIIPAMTHHGNWWYWSPLHFGFRIAVVALLFCGLFLSEETLKTSQWLSSASSLVKTIGQESLFVYVFHLMIVYGSVVNLGIAFFVGPNLDPIPVALLTVIIIGLTTYCTQLWFTGKRAQTNHPKRLVTLSLALFFTIFFIIPKPIVEKAELWLKTNFPQSFQPKQ